MQAYSLPSLLFTALEHLDNAVRQAEKKKGDSYWERRHQTISVHKQNINFDKRNQQCSK